MRAPLNNPVVPNPETEEMFRAFEALIDQLEQRADRSPKSVTVPLLAIAATTTVIVIPRVSKDGFAFGRMVFTPTAVMSADSTNYWTFTFYRYFTDSDGVRAARPIPGSTWNTSGTAIRANVPTMLTVKRPLNKGETLALVITKTASAATFTGTLQVSEIFGPEE